MTFSGNSGYFDSRLGASRHVVNADLSADPCALVDSRRTGEGGLGLTLRGYYCWLRRRHLSLLQRIRCVERDSGKKGSCYEIAQRYWNQIPEQKLADRNRRTEQHAGRYKKHVHNRVLVAECKKRHNRKPHGSNLSDGGARDQCEQRTNGDHPIAQYRFHDRRGPAACAKGRISQSLFLGCLL